MKAREVTLDDARAYIDQLDLNYITRAMCHVSYPLPRWDLPDALHCLNLYKNFLWLQKKYYPQALVPTREIDEFWHNHILYTKNYFQDCLHIFGHYLHHEPLSLEEAPETLSEDYLKTKQLYLSEFGESLDLVQKP